MKRLLSSLALLALMTVLFACGGGGGGGGGDSSNSTNDTIAASDSTAPTVTAFSMPATATDLTVAVTTLTATDAVGVTGYMITTSSTAPVASAAGWSAATPSSFKFEAAGAQTAYAWVKDAAGNVSTSKSAAVVITLPTVTQPANNPPVVNPPAATVAKDVSGVVTNPVTGTALGGATVTALVQLNNLVAKSVAAAADPTATTNADGTYTISGLIAGTTYYFVISAPTFASFTYYNITPDATNPLTLENARILPSAIAAQTATVSGKVKNASTNIGLPNMTVKLRANVNNRTGTVISTTTTDATTGAYSFAALAAGTYTAEVTGNIGTTPIITSYFTLVSIPTMNSLNANQDFPVTIPLSSSGPGQYRIVLNWGNDPRDLDSHLTGPTGTSGTRFHTAFYADDYPLGSSAFNLVAPFNRIAGATTEAFLDVDNTSHGTDNGPETTTIVVPRTGTYRFYVHHYSGVSNISASGAQVKVYKGSALLATYNPPAGAAGLFTDVWSVFSMDVTSGGETITPINTITSTDTSTLAKAVAKLAGPTFEQYYLFSNLPRK